MNRFDSYFEGRNVRTCCGNEVPGLYQFTNVQWMVALLTWERRGECILEQVDARA